MLMWWYFGIAILGGAIGFVQGWRALKRSRQGTVYKNALAHWKVNPTALWKQGTSGVFVVINTGSISILAILLVFSIERSVASTTAPSDIIWFSFGILFATYNCGLFLALPLGGPLIRPMSIFILPSGVGLGSSLIPWDRFDYFNIDVQDRFIRLYARHTSGRKIINVRLPDTVLLDQATDLLRRYLTSSPSGTSFKWYENQPAYVGFTLLYALPLVSIGILLYILAVPWAWYYCFGAILAVLGLSWLQLKIYGIG